MDLRHRKSLALVNRTYLHVGPQSAALANRQAR
jgi:hypothetical protein